MTRFSSYKCSICPYECSSLNEFKEHVLKAHNSYQNKPEEKPIDLTVQTLISFRTTKQKVKWLLENKPQCRGDDMLCYIEFMKYFEKAFIYIPESQRIVFKDPNGISYKDFQYLTSWETVRRTRQKIQEQDKTAYHKDNEGKPLEIILEHNCLLGSERTTLKRERKETVLHDNMRYL